MGDLVKRLRAADRGWPTMLSTAADRIEALEAEVRSLRDRRNLHQASASRAKDRVGRLRKRKAALMSALLEINACDDLREAKFIARIGHDGWEDDEVIHRNRGRIHAARSSNDLQSRLTAMTANAVALAGAAAKSLKAEHDRRQKLLPGAPASAYTDARIAEIETALAAHAKIMEGK